MVLDASDLTACICDRPATVAPETKLSDIVFLMERSRQSAIVVVDGEQRPIGILTERDILCLTAELLRGEDVFDRTAAEVMSPQPVTLTRDERLYDALVISQNRRIRHLPVVDAEGRLIGMVTHPELINAHLRLIDEQAERLKRAVARETEDLARSNRELFSLSMTDALLGIGNRRAMEADLRHSIAMARAHRAALCLMLIDVDHFKKYNDRYGHLAGDEALRAVVARIQRVIRQGDRLYRYGGEELLLLLPDCPGRRGIQVGRRILDAFDNDPIPHAAAPLGRISVSIGIACMEPSEFPDGATPEVLLALADDFLYEAKASGRNCIRGPHGKMQAA